MALENSLNFKERFDGILLQFAWCNDGDAGVKVYKGIQPTGPFFDWSIMETSRVGDLLIDFDNGFSIDDDGFGNLIFKPSDGPTTKNAAASGTATWAAIYSATFSDTAAIGPVTLSSGNGLLFLDSVTITSGNPYNIVGFRITLL